MSGIYLHIPFCKHRCLYCDFYSTTSVERQAEYVDALCKELWLRRDFLPSPHIDTVYVGGGTPSLLTPDLLERLFDTVCRLYRLSPTAEVTLEANPDDVTADWLRRLGHLPVNRLSLGVQTFDDTLLRFLHRRHTSGQAQQAISLCRQVGFENLSIDLMYGLPGQTAEVWEQDVNRALESGVRHISAYALMYEEGTPLWRLRQAGRIKEADEELSRACYEYLTDRLTAAGFVHYEISNFSLPGYASRHNTSYWSGLPYLGCGPAAHSFCGRRRQWNTSDLTHYLRAIRDMEAHREPHPPLFAFEDLNDDERYNDLIITRLRTRQGLDLHALRLTFGEERLLHCLRNARPHLQQGTLQRLPSSAEAPEGTLVLTRQGLFISDNIMSDLLLVDD